MEKTMPKIYMKGTCVQKWALLSLILYHNSPSYLAITVSKRRGNKSQDCLNITLLPSPTSIQNATSVDICHLMHCLLLWAGELFLISHAGLCYTSEEWMLSVLSHHIVRRHITLDVTRLEGKNPCCKLLYRRPWVSNERKSIFKYTFCGAKLQQKSFYRGVPIVQKPI